MIDLSDDEARLDVARVQERRKIRVAAGADRYMERLSPDAAALLKVAP